MSLLDLQSLDVPQSPGKKRPKGSRASKGCFPGPSNLSIILCNGSTFRPAHDRENGS